MQIEVTEEEAMGIYSQRYLDNRGKVKRHLPFALLTLATIAGLCVMYLVNDWLGVAVVVVLVSPSVVMFLKALRASGKYARSQIEEQG